MMWKSHGKTKGKDAGELTAFIDEASEIDGKFTFSGTVMINGRLRGEINLAAQNGLYLVLLLLGGMVVPFDELLRAR